MKLRTRIGTILMTAISCLMSLQAQELNQLASESSDIMPKNAPFVISKHENRPRIAVVLAGGGAKGVAHVAALKAIEDAGIPIDLVVGTSMGSIVGGAYCAGYSPDTMRTIIKNTDWIKMITDNPDFHNRNLSGKKDNEHYVIRSRIDMQRLKSGTGKGGVIEGRNVLHFFESLTYMLPDSLDFQDLPVPFACVGTRAIDGGCKIFTNGNLPKAIRASMAIPTAFTPVTINDTVYVDGGVVDNFPVDIARMMGADIVIGVDLQVKQDNDQLTNSAIDLLMHCIDFYSIEQQKKNREDADIYIPIDVTGYTAASFEPEQLDTLMARGDYYVSLKKHELDSLGQALALNEAPQRIRLGDYSFASTRSGSSNWTIDEDEIETSFRKANGGSLYSSMNIGGRFDNHEYATLLAKLNVVLSKEWASLLSLSCRLGARLELKSDFSMRTIGNQRIGVNYKFQDMDLQYFRKGDPIVSMDQKMHRVNLYITQEWHNVKYTFGMNYHMYLYDNIIASENSIIDKILGNHTIRYSLDGVALPDTRTDGSSHFFSYYIKSELNSLDRQYFPRSGHRIELSGDLITDNLYQYKGEHPELIAALDWTAAWSVGATTTFIPRISSRIIFGNDNEEPWALKNLVGNLFDEMYFMQQRTMAGVNKMVVIDEGALLMAGMKLQQELIKDHYLELRGDFSTAIESATDINLKSRYWGVEAGYSIKTKLGPISAKVGWSNLTKRAGFALNAGYYF